MSKTPVLGSSQAVGQLSAISNKTSPTLSDMPIDTVGLIVEKLDYRQQLKLRKVSKSLRELVDNRKPACKSIHVLFSMKSVDITFNEQCVMYTNYEYDYRQYNYTGMVVIRDDFKKVAFDDLTSTLKNPKLHLEKLSVCSCFVDKEDIEKSCNEIRDLLEELDHQVSVKELELNVPSLSYLFTVLPYLKPGVLENITLYLLDTIDSNIHSTEMNQIALLEQWKQAKEIELQYCFDKFPMEYATHFKRFLIKEFDIDDDKFTRIRNFLFKLDNFEQCTLYCGSFFAYPDFVYELLGAPVSSNTKEEVFHHPILDSDYYFEFKKANDSDDVIIVKKKRESN